MRNALIICFLTSLLFGCGYKPTIQAFLALQKPPLSDSAKVSTSIKQYLDGKPLFDGDDIISAEQNSQHPNSVTITLSKAAILRLTQATRAQIKAQIVMVVDGNITSRTAIRSPLTSPKMTISGVSAKLAGKIDKAY